MKPATRWFDWPFTPMPHSGYTICTSEQLLTSTTVSHGFIMEWYSSPPFGSHGPCNHSEPCPLDFSTGALCQSLRLSKTDCFHHALWFGDNPQAKISASSIDSSVRVSRRAESDTGHSSPSSALHTDSMQHLGNHLAPQGPPTRVMQPPWGRQLLSQVLCTATGMSSDTPGVQQSSASLLKPFRRVLVWPSATYLREQCLK